MVSQLTGVLAEKGENFPEFKSSSPNNKGRQKNG
jgi:hypothetical protein